MFTGFGFNKFDDRRELVLKNPRPSASFVSTSNCNEIT